MVVAALFIAVVVLGVLLALSLIFIVVLALRLFVTQRKLKVQQSNEQAMDDNQYQVLAVC